MITKLDDIHVAEVEQVENKVVHTKTELLARKERAEKELLKVNSLLDALAAA